MDATHGTERPATEVVHGHQQWRTGFLRLVVAHSTSQQSLVNELRIELAELGVNHYPLNESTHRSLARATESAAALRTTHAFVALIDPDFNTSHDVQQSVGWALGRGVPIFAIRMGAEPHGFLRGREWPSATSQRASVIAGLIYTWISDTSRLSEQATSGLFAALEAARDFDSVSVAAEKIGKIETLSDAGFERLSAIYHSSHAMQGAAMTRKHLRPLFDRHGRAWPPRNPADTSDNL